MIDLILRDAAMYPRLFWWTTPLSILDIDVWEREHLLVFPRDLKELWSSKGGADFFETETILQPFGVKEEYDLIEPVSTVHWERGLSQDFCVFHTGLVDSVFRKSNGAIFSLPTDDPTQMTPFRDLNEWYVDTVRSVYEEAYGLEALV
ncbi:MAG: hypothetical protein QOG55_851 [Acidobacteriaceae bacterium]|nr:hypothetical protein [Acidobacteriaceae bacterium]